MEIKNTFILGFSTLAPKRKSTSQLSVDTAHATLSFLGPDMRPLQDQDQARRAERTGHSMGEEENPSSTIFGGQAESSGMRDLSPRI